MTYKSKNKKVLTTMYIPKIPTKAGVFLCYVLIFSSWVDRAYIS